MKLRGGGEEDSNKSASATCCSCKHFKNRILLQHDHDDTEKQNVEHEMNEKRKNER